MRSLLFSLLFIASQAIAEDHFSKALEFLSSDIKAVWSGGEWKHGDKKGSYRFIIIGGGFEHHKTLLYVQWLGLPAHNEKPSIINTTSITELNEALLYSFNLPTCLENWQCNNVELEAAHVHAGTHHKFVLKFTNIGQYEIKAL